MPDLSAGCSHGAALLRPWLGESPQRVGSEIVFHRCRFPLAVAQEGNGHSSWMLFVV